MFHPTGIKHSFLILILSALTLAGPHPSFCSDLAEDLAAAATNRAASGTLQAATPELSALADSATETLTESERMQFAAGAYEANCSLCHGIDGKAMGDHKMDLTDTIWRHGGSLEEIAKTISEGVEGTPMKPNKEDYTTDQIEDIASYVLQLAQEMHAETEKPKLNTATELTNVVSKRVPSAPFKPIKKHENFIDDHIFGKMEADGIPHAGICTDTEFIRRAHLDLWGRLPDAEVVRSFVEGATPEKRNKLIDHLLGYDFKEKFGERWADDFLGVWNVEEPFISKWGYFFADLFRSGSGATSGFGGEFPKFIKTFLKFDIPYDYVVREMLTATTLSTATNAAASFLILHKVAGANVDFDTMHEDTCDDIAITATKLFLGVNLECVSCHGGAGHLEGINLWLKDRTREEFWRQAAFFGDMRLFVGGFKTDGEYILLDGPPLRPEYAWAGKISDYEFTSPPSESGGMGYRPEAPSVKRIARDKTADVYPAFMFTEERPRKGENLREEFARILTSDFQFAKATANLIWSKFMTVGIVDPPFEWDLARQDPANPPPEPWTIQPSHPELLDELARFFQEKKYSLREIMRLICQSKAYQMSSRFEGEYKPEYDRYFARKLARRLTAEEIYDALAKATNVFGHGIEFVLQQNGLVGDAELSRFLRFLGQTDRNGRPPDTKNTILSVSMMLNSDVVRKKVLRSTEDSRTSLLLSQDPPLSNMEIVEDLFLHTLSRFPTNEEMVTSIRHIEDYRDKGAEDLQWALVNKLEFIVNF